MLCCQGVIVSWCTQGSPIHMTKDQRDSYGLVKAPSDLVDIASWPLTITWYKLLNYKDLLEVQKKRKRF